MLSVRGSHSVGLIFEWFPELFPVLCIMKLSNLFCAILASSAVSALPAQSVTDIADHPNSTLVGYLGAFFLGDAPNVYFYLSNGNNALSFKALNGGEPILVPSSGTGGVRDPSIITGGGCEAGKKWYIIGTDLDIGKVNYTPRVLRFISCMCPGPNVNVDHLGRSSA